MSEDFSKYNGEGTMLRKAQLRMLDILVEIDKICRKHNINYYLDGGTLLGAVRHKGFIPWDDDVDIIVFKKDYKKLSKILIAELPEQFYFSDRTTNKHHIYGFGKVKDRNSVVEDVIFDKSENQGVYVDIFTCSYSYSSRFRKFVNFFHRRVHRELFLKGDALCKSKFRKGINFAIAAASSPFVYSLVIFHKILAAMKNKRLLSYDLISTHVTYPEDVFSPPNEIEFEGKMFLCVNNTDKYLSILYGNYMQIPPEEKRAPHATKIEIYD